MAPEPILTRSRVEAETLVTSDDLALELRNVDPLRFDWLIATIELRKTRALLEQVIVDDPEPKPTEVDLDQPPPGPLEEVLDAQPVDAWDDEGDPEDAELEEDLGYVDDDNDPEDD